jgi:P-type Cu2+ transporter
MIRDWLGLPGVTGVQDAVAPVFGTILFFYGGRPFLAGAVSELRARQPGMMTLIALAISVAFLTSAATVLGLRDLEFWWEWPR